MRKKRNGITSSNDRKIIKRGVTIKNQLWNSKYWGTLLGFSQHTFPVMAVFVGGL